MTTERDSSSREVGDLLREQGKLTDKQLEQVRRRQHRLGLPQHRVVVELNYASEEDTYRALGTLKNLDFIDLSSVTLNPAILEQVPVKLILHYHMIPLSIEGEVLTIAFSDPPKQIELGNLRLLLGKTRQDCPRHPQLPSTPPSKRTSASAPKPSNACAPNAG